MLKTGNWHPLKNRPLKREHALLKEIIQGLDLLTNDVLSDVSKKKLTNKVKRTLIDLAHADTHQFKAYANGFSAEDLQEIGHQFVNLEWQFDVNFYTDLKESDFMPAQFIFTCECEWIKNESKKMD